MFTKKIKGNTYLEIIMQISIIIFIVSGVLTIYDLYREPTTKAELYENLLTSVNKQSYHFKNQKIKGNINSLEFINKELNFKDLKKIEKNVNLDIIIRAKENTELESFYLILTPIEMPFYRSSYKKNLMNIIEKLNERKENKYQLNDYYAANKNDILKKIPIEECKRTSECVLIIATKKT